MILLYDLLASAVVWLALVPHEVVRIALGRSRGRDLLERLGGFVPEGERRPCVVVHAVSAGEVAAASALVARLAARAPDLAVVMTTANDAGRRAAARVAARFRNVAGVGWMPWDRARSLRAWLGRLRPRAVVVVETEIWPGLFRVAEELGIPLLVVSGRVYPRDVARYRLAAGFFRGVLARAAWLGVKSEEELGRFVAIGAALERVEVMGDLKHDAPPPDPETLGGGGGPVIVAGSTHEPEEDLLLAAASRLRSAHPALRLVLAPRDPRRAPAVAALAGRRGFTAALLSGRAREAAVLVVDEIGRLPSLWAAADVAVVGGSFAPRGGHNPLEPAAHGKAIVLGPHVAHFREAVERLAEAGAVVRIEDPRELEARLGALLDDPDARAELGRRARAVFDAGSGAADRAVDRLLQRIADRR